jgi:hypothetical protein
MLYSQLYICIDSAYEYPSDDYLIARKFFNLASDESSEVERISLGRRLMRGDNAPPTLFGLAS